MEKELLNRKELNSFDKEVLIQMLLSTAQQLEHAMQRMNDMSKQLEETNCTIHQLTEQLAIANQRLYGRKSEKNLVTAADDGEQLNFFSEIFNEIEVHADLGPVDEPEIETAVKGYTRKKSKGKREKDLSGLPVRIEEHTLSDDQLSELFPDGYRYLPDEIYKKLEFHPATFEVVEHHIKVYKGKKNGSIVRANHPDEMIDHSIATPSLAAAIINAKYTNSMPLYRQEQEFLRQDVTISRQVMANWVITVTKRYFQLLYDRMKQELLKSHVIHADETPVNVTRDGREGIHDSWMWVYRTGTMCDTDPIIIYEYQKTRQKEHPANFLKGFSGVLVSDGLQGYESIQKESGNRFKLQSCWVHARRGFADFIKSIGKANAKGTTAYKAAALIQAIYKEDNKLAELSPDERLEKRQSRVRPLVEAFFAWAKEESSKGLPKGKTDRALSYCLNREEHLKTFLTDGTVPLDNNMAEVAIRGFVIGRNNWKLIDTVSGAKSSAVLYSIVETAKANNLKIYEYLKYILTESPKHYREAINGNFGYIEDMLPWSENLPDECRKKK